MELNITSYEFVFKRSACHRACACLRASLFVRVHFCVHLYSCVCMFECISIKVLLYSQDVILINEKVECMSFVDISCDM